MSEEPKRKPAKWKMAIVIWLGIYPTITLAMATVGQIILPLNIPIYLKTLPITLIVVPIMVFVVLPVLQRFLSHWLNK